MKKRKKRLVIVAVLIVLIGIGGWYLFLGGRIKDAVASATPNSNQAMEGSDTEAAAKMIQELTGADLFQIRTKRYYRSSFSGTAATAWNEETLNLRPGLAAQPENLDDYDVIYVGFPTGGKICRCRSIPSLRNMILAQRQSSHSSLMVEAVLPGR